MEYTDVKWAERTKATRERNHLCAQNRRKKHIEHNTENDRHSKQERNDGKI